MIEEKEILLQIKQLPEKLKEELIHYINFLQKENSKQNASGERKPRKAGSSPDKYILALDFNASLEDFKEYT